jgi:hypothetical protein
VIILKYILKKHGVRCRVDSAISRWDPAVGSCEDGNKAPDSIKG